MNGNDFFIDLAHQRQELKRSYCTAFEVRDAELTVTN